MGERSCEVEFVRDAEDEMSGFCWSDLPLYVSIDSSIDRSVEDNVDRVFFFTVVALSLLNLRRRSQKLTWVMKSSMNVTTL